LSLLAGVLFVAGLLCVIETVVTLVWQDPLTMLQARASQRRLAGQLAALEREPRLTAARRPPADAAGQVRHLQAQAFRRAARREQRLATGQPLGQIVIPRIASRFVFVQGSDDAAIRLGPGHYPYTSLPGQPGTVGIAGHRTTYLAPFRHLDALHRGDRIRLLMPYGTFTYRVISSNVVSPQDTAVLRRVGHEHRLALTACTPLYSAAQRLVVTALLSRATPRALHAPASGHGLWSDMRKEQPYRGRSAR
jgi:sortase A